MSPWTDSTAAARAGHFSAQCASCAQWDSRDVPRVGSPPMPAGRRGARLLDVRMRSQLSGLSCACGGQD